jgi:hypothetical protein
VSHLAHLSNGFREEWRSLLRGQHSVLIEGPEESTEAALLLLKPHLRQLVMWQRRGLAVELPVVYPGALVVRHIDALPAVDQTRLLEWLGRATTPIQVVCTQSTPLFDLVEAGRFDRTLYYRLNVALLRVGIDVTPELTAETSPSAAR